MIQIVFITLADIQTKLDIDSIVISSANAVRMHVTVAKHGIPFGIQWWLMSTRGCC